MCLSSIIRKRSFLNFGRRHIHEPTERAWRDDNRGQGAEGILRAGGAHALREACLWFDPH